MKKIILLLLFIFILSPPILAHHGDHEVLLEPQQIKIKVNGVVCSFCAYGAQKKLSKLKFLNKTVDNKGVHVDIDHQMITLTLDDSKSVDLSKVYELIQSGGYESEVVYMFIHGDVNAGSLVKDARTQLAFQLDKSIDGSRSKELRVHFDAKLIAQYKEEQGIKATLDEIIN